MNLKISMKLLSRYGKIWVGVFWLILDMVHVLIRCRRALKNSDAHDKQELMGRASEMIKKGIPMVKWQITWMNKPQIFKNTTMTTNNSGVQLRVWPEPGIGKKWKSQFRCLKEREQGSMSIEKRKKWNSDALEAGMSARIECVCNKAVDRDEVISNVYLHVYVIEWLFEEEG